MLLKMERISWLQGSRIQASSHPESKRTVVLSPRVHGQRVQLPSVQGTSRPESKCPVVQRPRVQSPNVQTIRPESSFSGMPI